MLLPLNIPRRRRRRRRFAGAERGSRVSQIVFNRSCERMRAAEDAPRDRSRVLERRHALTKIVERGARVLSVSLAPRVLRRHDRPGPKRS